jgi:hypothetical protein
MITEIKIEKGIPIPPRGTGPKGGVVSLIKALAIGDSFTVSANKRSAITMWQKSAGVRLTSRRVDAETIRVWRVA